MHEKRWQDWLMLALGIWLFVSPLYLGYVDIPQAAWNAYVVGVGLIVFSIVAIARPALWGEWINLVLGVWLIIAPFVMPHESEAARWNHLIVGILVVADALLAVWMQPAQQPRHWFLSGRGRS